MAQQEPIHIQYLSQGTVETGGYRHERKLTSLLTEGFTQKGKSAYHTAQRLNGHFTTPTGYMRLMWWFFKQSSAYVNIVPLRGALPSIIRNLFTQRKTIVVLHSHVQPYSSAWLRILYAILLWVLKVFKPKRTSIVTIAQCWKKEFQQAGVSASAVFVVPNLFDTKQYLSYRTSIKQKSIHFGMMEPKTDMALMELATRLTAKGYYCYFSTTESHKAKQTAAYDIVYFEQFEKYLKAMAESLVTIQFPSIQEGWSRIGHESILVGTTLIGKPVGGLAELLDESGALVANTIDEVEVMIDNKMNPPVRSGFIEKYDGSQAAQWIQPLVNFCLS